MHLILYQKKAKGVKEIKILPLRFSAVNGGRICAFLRGLPAKSQIARRSRRKLGKICIASDKRIQNDNAVPHRVENFLAEVRKNYPPPF